MQVSSSSKTTSQSGRTAYRTAYAVLSWLVLPLFLLAQPAFCQSEGADSEDGFFIETLDVNLVNVEVYVTDKKGNRVHGLTVDDFELFEDGRPVKITNFYSVADGRSVQETMPTLDRPQPTDEPSQTARPGAADTIPESQRLSLIVYIDNLHIRPFNRNKVMAKVRSFLNTKVPAGSQVMLVTFERSLKIRQPFTPDFSLVSNQTYELEELSAFTVQRETERDNIIKRILRTSNATEAESHADFYAKSVYNDLEISIRGMREMISSLAGLPGRKALLYVSDGLEMRAGEDLFQLVAQEHPELQNRGAISMQANRYNVRRSYQEVVAHANANRVTFYTIEAAGLRSHSSLSAERAGGVSTIEVDFTYQMNRQETLLMLADDTGGLATINTNNFAGALEKIAEDFSSYYSLGYLPAHSGDGRFHRIEVKVRKKGLKVRHRDGYRDKSLDTRIQEGTLASLLYDRQSNPLNISIELLDPVRDKQRQVFLPIEVRIPIGEMALLPRGEFHEGKMRVSLAVMDDEGELSPVEMTPVPIQIPERDLAVAKTKYYVYSANLRMETGRQKIAVGVRDEISGEQSYVTYSAAVGI